MTGASSLGPTKTIRILLCDDHPVVRSGLEAMLLSQPDFWLVGQAENGVEAVTLAWRLRPDVALMDLKMPEMDGVTAIARIKEQSPATAVLVLTSYDSDSDVERALSAGALDALNKDAPRGEIFEAIRRIAAGLAPRSCTVTAPTPAPARRRAAGELTDRELDVLRLVSEGLSNPRVADTLWISEQTVKDHLRNIFKKLGVHDRTAAATTAQRRGLL